MATVGFKGLKGLLTYLLINTAWQKEGNCLKAKLLILWWYITSCLNKLRIFLSTLAAFLFWQC